MSEIWDLALSSTAPASAFRKTRPPLALNDLAAILSPQTPYLAARRLSQFLEALAHPSLPGLDQALSHHLPIHLPTENPLPFLGERMPLLLALDVPHTHCASAYLLCEWLDANQGRSLATEEKRLLGQSIRDHFEALGKRSETREAEQQLCACTTAFLLATRDLPQPERNNIFEAVSDVPTWRTLNSTYWRVLSRTDKAKVNLAINGPQASATEASKTPQKPVFLPEIPNWPKEKTSPRPGKSL